MRDLSVQASLFLAVAATVGLAFFVLRDRPSPEGVPPAEGCAPEEAEAPPERRPERAVRFRPYQTADTLREDLRDALALPDADLDAECWRVSGALESVARWTLVHLAPDEASPKVRALLVLATGVHVPGERALHRFLDDDAPVVRAATVLAMGHRKGGSPDALFLGAVRVPLGNEDVAHLKPRYEEQEKDAMVRSALGAVISAAGLSSRR